VGSIEHQIDSRDIEDEDGLIVTRPGLAVVMFIGILGMFLAPFGMLISKWAALQAFVDASPILAILLAFGSAPTLFFWTKWMGKIVSVPMGSTRAPGAVPGDEWTALGILAALTLSAVALFPLVGSTTINPYLVHIYGKTVSLAQGNILIMLIMFGLFLVIPLTLGFLPKTQRVTAYMAGANVDDTARFRGSMGMVQNLSLRNYYLSTLFTEGGLSLVSVITTVILILAMFAAVGLK
jgi:ech hydrogenase subunit A